jgi:hypothetical protein
MERGGVAMIMSQFSRGNSSIGDMLNPGVVDENIALPSFASASFTMAWISSGFVMSAPE